MSELMRVLKPGGWAILQVPIALVPESTDEDPTVVDPDEREARFGQYDHVRLYGRDYVARLERAGFSVEQFRAIEQFGEAQVRRNGLQPEETLFVCSKPVLQDVSRPSEVPAAGAQSKDDPQHETSAGARSNRVH
jgi:hypothetical protein